MKGKSIEYKGLPRATHEGNHFQGLGRFPWLLRLYVFKSFAHTVPEISVQPLSQEDLLEKRMVFYPSHPHLHPRSPLAPAPKKEAQGNIVSLRQKTRRSLSVCLSVYIYVCLHVSVLFVIILLKL